MKPFTFKYLDVENSVKIQEELTNFITPYCVSKPTGLWSVDLNDFYKQCFFTTKYLQENNILEHLKKVCYVVVHPGAGERDAHVDNNIEPPLTSGESSGCLSINFPIANCDDTPVLFYEYLNGPKEYIELPNPKEGSYIFYAKSNLKEIDRYLLTKPIIMNNTVPHAIYNSTDKIRISVSIRFLIDPWNLTQTNQ